LFGPGSHGSTFGGNPLACRAALSVLEVLERDQLAERAAELGTRLLSALQTRLAGRPGVKEVRGMGLLLGIELERPCGALVTRALAAGLLINVTAERVVRLLPPLILSDAEADQLVSLLGNLIEAFLDEQSRGEEA
jgi:acetylornithine aminotransferase